MNNRDTLISPHLNLSNNAVAYGPDCIIKLAVTSTQIITFNIYTSTNTYLTNIDNLNVKIVTIIKQLLSRITLSYNTSVLTYMTFSWSNYVKLFQYRLKGPRKVMSGMNNFSQKKNITALLDASKKLSSSSFLFDSKCITIVVS